MKNLVAVFYLVFAVLLISCNKEDSVPAASDSPHATVMLRDGTKVSGAVSKSTPSDITLLLDGGTTRSISMKDVRSVNYDDSAPDVGARSKAVSSESHENHYHPNRASIQTKTFVAPVGTEISVRTEESIDSGTAVEGQTYAGEVTSDVLDAEKAVVIPHGSNAQIVIKSASKGGRFRGASDHDGYRRDRKEWPGRKQTHRRVRWRRSRNRSDHWGDCGTRKRSRHWGRQWSGCRGARRNPDEGRLHQDTCRVHTYFQAGPAPARC
jgi:hypothetical protein